MPGNQTYWKCEIDPAYQGIKVYDYLARQHLYIILADTICCEFLTVNSHLKKENDVDTQCIRLLHEVKRPGNDLLFHTLRCSTISAIGFHFRVRNGIGWDTYAIITRSFNLILNIKLSDNCFHDGWSSDSNY